MALSYLPLHDAHLARAFRLLHILPARGGEEGSILRCWLRHFFIHQAPTYRAISYTWGDPFAADERNNETDLEETIVDDERVSVDKSVTSAPKAICDWHTVGPS